MLGGEKFVPVKKTPTKLFNGYGPTEFTVCSSFYQVSNERHQKNIPIGRPVSNTLSVIVDNEGRLVPQGAIGELCLISRQMSRGYWKQEELTKKHSPYSKCSECHSINKEEENYG